MIDYETMYSWVGNLPIVDWHNHLDMQMLAEDRPLGSLYEVWVKADPYKHRAMRICGEPERVVAGDADEDAKWEAWKRTLPKLVGNPLFAWAKMELEWLFGKGAFKVEGGKLALENVSLSDWTPSKMLRAFNVEYISPCVGAGDLGKLENPIRPESLENSGLPACRVVPSLRMNAGDEVARETLGRFDAAGCRVVDVSVDDVSQLASNLHSLTTVASFAAEHGWTMLLHLGALRETSARLRAVAGPAGGFAGMRAPVDPAAVVKFLDCLDAGNGHVSCPSVLPRTVLMSLNPEAHAQLAVLAGSFVQEGMPGKVQLGPAWWWCDHKEGIIDVLEKNAAYGVLSTFVGMTTDSRSLLSFVRHDYFRRILSEWAAGKVASGDFPDDESLLRPMMESICCRNARKMVLDS